MPDGINVYAPYGTEFDEPEDDKKSFSKKPAPIQDQVATDEKGRRRFHGAFTGGFSAGYFNTVGSKQGFVCQEFTSSVGNRASQAQQKAEDFMDADDLGEFGISSRRIRTSDQFAGEGGSAVGGKRRLAWEHDSSASGSVVQSALESAVRPVSNSVGARMLRSMGWREGRGVGLATVTQQKSRGGKSTEADFDREQMRKVAPGYDMSLDDESLLRVEHVDGLKGLGYHGLAKTNVLDQAIGQREIALKLKQKTRGIRGQAFGVGAFEEDDDSVYTNYDLSQYDFSLGSDGDVVGDPGRVDATFVKADKDLRPRKFYLPPRLPPNYQPVHKVIPMDLSRLPPEIRSATKELSAVQRAKFLGEDRVSVLQLVSDEDKKRLADAKAASAAGSSATKPRSRWDQKEHEQEKRSADRNRIAFPDEPMKQRRFKEFLNYLYRGLPYPQPSDMSVWEWESEKKEFEAKLTSEERGMLPDVRSRSQPLAKSSLALPIQELLQSKFTKETGKSGKIGTNDEDKMSAVKMGMFGERTRLTYEWYPDNVLAKRFNVPNPYPGSYTSGCPALQKSSKSETLLNLGLPNTAAEVFMRNQQRMNEPARRERDRERENVTSKDVDELASSTQELGVKEADLERPPEIFFNAIFGESESDDSESSSDEDDEDAPNAKTNGERRQSELPKPSVAEDLKPSTSAVEKTPPKKVITVMDLDDDYGPAPPPPSSSSGDAAQLSGFSVLRYLQEELDRKKKEKRERRDREGKRSRSRERSRERHRSKKSSKDKKEKKAKKHKKEKKSKHKKKEKRRSSRHANESDDSEESSGSDSDVIPC